MGYIYIVTNKYKTVFYTGTTNNIERRICEHKAGVGSSFSSKYRCSILLYYEQFMTMGEAIQMEKKIKRWPREWKLNTIKEKNPELLDLASDWFAEDDLTAIVEEYKRRKYKSES